MQNTKWYYCNYNVFDSHKRWELKSKDAMDEMDMDLTPWLRGFVKSVGMQNAKILLNETGLFGSKVI